MEKLFDTLELWYDEVPRTGEMNMALDQILLERASQQAVLRVYQWSEPTVSFGYFLSAKDSKKIFGEEKINYVRRWTGGGVVDHRCDRTFTLVVPRGHPFTKLRTCESYKKIHHALVVALEECGVGAQLTSNCEGNIRGACFEHPVAYDVLNAKGKKIAGGAQRRSRNGLLHQGSVLVDVEPEKLCQAYADKLSSKLMPCSPCDELIALAEDLVASRYGKEEWLNRVE